MKQYEITVGGFVSPLAFLLLGNSREILIAVTFGKGEAPKKTAACLAGRIKDYQPVADIMRRYKEDSVWYNVKGGLRVQKSVKYHSVVEKIGQPHEKLSMCTVISEALGTSYLLTDRRHLYDDLYSAMVLNSSLPIAKEWTQAIYHELRYANNIVEVDLDHRYETRYSRVFYADGFSTIRVRDEDYSVDDLMLLDIRNMVDSLPGAIEDCFRKGRISMSPNPKPMPHKDVDSYLEAYSKDLLNSMQESLQPKTELSGKYFALLKDIKLYSQQAVCVNGIVAQWKEARSCFAVEGMGSGKTIQALAAMEAYTNEKYAKAHGITDLKEIYKPEHQKNIAYRAIVVCPSHLVDKWAREARGHLVDVNVIVARSTADMVRIKAHPPTGKTIVVVSKENIKADAAWLPIPTKIGHGRGYVRYCKNCLDKDKSRVSMKADGCPVCDGKDYKRVMVLPKAEGLRCPHCGEIMVKMQRDGFYREMMPKDFAQRNQKNDKCPACGEPLWAAEGAGRVKSAVTNAKIQKKPIWYRICYKRSAALNIQDESNAIVLLGHEDEFVNSTEGRGRGWRESATTYLRKFPMARYIQKQMKGFFDFCVMDEVHKYAGESAQGLAVARIAAASKKLLALTGTLSNGHASSMWRLGWVFLPGDMKKLGFDYDAISVFKDRYGTKETTFKVSSQEGYTGSAMSSAKMHQSAEKETAGLSPALYTDLLCQNAVMLDLCDFSSSLPEFKEIIIPVPMEDPLRAEYKVMRDRFSEAIHKTGGGMKLLAESLQCSLTYTDYPFHRADVYNKETGALIYHPQDFTWLIANNELLNKEHAVMGIVKKELDEGRNCMVYLQKTNPGADGYCMDRMAELIKYHADLDDHEVAILPSAKPKAAEREAWIHEKAKQGVRVFLCNPKVVETGLDLVFEEDGIEYNYPTIVFAQLGYEIASQMQASRRSYRIIQTKETRVYYVVSKGCIQTDVLQIAASKVKAINTIQGRFSSDGLSLLAQGVDDRALLAERLAAAGETREEDVQKMMDENNAANRVESEYAGFEVTPEYYEYMGISPITLPIEEVISPEEIPDTEAIEAKPSLPVIPGENTEGDATEVIDLMSLIAPQTPVVEKARKKKSVELILDDFFDTFFGVGKPVLVEKTKKSKKRPVLSGDFTDLLAQ